MDKECKEKMSERRVGPRREADRIVLTQLERYKKLYHVGQIITSGIEIGDTFETVMEQTDAIMNCERSTVFLHDKKTDELWSIAATGTGHNEIRIPSDHGIAGWVFKNRKPLIINDPYDDPRFFPEVDKATGFKTVNILCIPLINRKGECIGSLQALNAEAGEFTAQDLDMLESVANYVSIALENARLYEDLKLMNKARERVISHLSHELKTPLAILSAVFDRLVKQLREMALSKLEKTATRGQRNLIRLLDLQEKIDDIMNQRQTAEKTAVLNIIETALSLMEEFEEGSGAKDAEMIRKAAERVESIFHTNSFELTLVAVDELAGEVCDEVQRNMGMRLLEISKNLRSGARLATDRTMLKKVIGGLLKNAVENTPDEGKIEIACCADEDWVTVDVKDFGVGISPTNQKLIFTGFIHTQDTEAYSSKRPYAFNAGGAGADLFRMKAFSERFGFLLSHQSERCGYIPDDVDLCPGKISDCPHCSKRQDCFDSGTSLFRVRFPIDQK